jgi:phosphoglycerate dehydrogenase-like enzyme
LHKNAIIINIGRGDAIHTDALLEALDAKAIGGAALDVTDPEPLPAGHPLFGRRDVLLTPHLSGRTVLYWDMESSGLRERLLRTELGMTLIRRDDHITPSASSSTAQALKLK